MQKIFNKLQPLSVMFLLLAVSCGIMLILNSRRPCQGELKLEWEQNLNYFRETSPEIFQKIQLVVLSEGRSLITIEEKASFLEEISIALGTYAEKENISSPLFKDVFIMFLAYKIVPYTFSSDGELVVEPYYREFVMSYLNMSYVKKRYKKSEKLPINVVPIKIAFQDKNRYKTMMIEARRKRDKAPMEDLSEIFDNFFIPSSF